MDKAFQNAKWIWCHSAAQVDEYGEFFTSFFWQNGKTVCRISCDGDYTLWVNGNFVASNQYGDYEHYKIYDEIDVTPWLKSGENRLAVLVWHYGDNSSRYCNLQAGVLFEVVNESTILAQSDEKTLCRMSKAYKNGNRKKISSQLGFGFAYDATQEDEWQVNPVGFGSSVVVDKFCQMHPRPIKKSVLEKEKVATVIAKEKGRYLIDLKEETVGLPVLRFISPKEQTIRVAFGEHIVDGQVRFSEWFGFDYVAKKGKNEYINYMLRLGCRYLEVFCEEEIEIDYIGLIPQVYPVKVKKKTLSNGLDQKIYDLCEKTLQLCMMEHYVDCPWREQCLYVFDSRNQMLCGYYVFENGNAEYARANLKLMSMDRREDGLLAITYPCGIDLTIPSFSLYYFIAVKEYIEHTGDVSLGSEVYAKLKSLLQTFIKEMKNDLVYKFEGRNHWNFYDWSKHAEGKLNGEEKAEPDLFINCLFVLALESLRYICMRIKKSFEYEEILIRVKQAIKANFYHTQDGLFSVTKDGKEYTELGNSLAVLCGILSKEENEKICGKLVDGGLIQCSLSMKTWKYEALLLCDQEKYKERILDEIRSTYKIMLDAGATSVWETIEGEKAFNKKGSLCHGWSAIPVYYYHKLLW